MSIKVRVSYEREPELLQVQEALSPIGMKWRLPPKRGKYNRAYAEADTLQSGLQGLYREARNIPEDLRTWETYESFKRRAYEHLTQCGVNPWDYLDEFRRKIADILKL